MSYSTIYDDTLEKRNTGKEKPFHYCSDSTKKNTSKLIDIDAPLQKPKTLLSMKLFA